MTRQTGPRLYWAVIVRAIVRVVWRPFAIEMYAGP